MFSELSFAEKDSGLKYDPQRLSLYGMKNGYGVIICDNRDEYILDIFAEEPYKYEKETSDNIINLSKSLSKNTINSQKHEYGYVEIRFNKNCLLQEKLIDLIDFLDKLTELMRNTGINGKPYVLQNIINNEKPKTSKKKSRIRLSFDFGSVKGLLGGIIATVVMIFISASVVRFNKNNPSSFSGEIGAYLISAATTALIFFDYRFLAKKLDPFGIIVCPLLSVTAAVFSPLLTAAKAAAVLNECSLGEAFGLITDLYSFNRDLAAFTAGYLTKGVVVAVFASLIICVMYFRKYPEQMTLTEISEENTENAAKK